MTLRPGRDLKALRTEIEGFRDRFPKLGSDELFVLWFLRAFVTESDDEAAAALVGGPGDKNVDAVLIDDDSKIVFIVQGKFRENLLGKNEKPNDVRQFAQLGPVLWGDTEEFADFSEDMHAAAKDRLTAARERLKRKYRLQLQYVTLGRCSDTLIQDAARVVRQAEGSADIDVIDGRRALLLFADYLDGVAPPVPSLDLEMESGRGVASEPLHRFDRRTASTLGFSR